MVDTVSAKICINLKDILTIIGLLITFAGAAKTALSVRLTSHEAGQTAAMRILSDDEADWKDMPLAQSLLKASRGAMWGLSIIAVGTLFQIAAVFL